MKKDKDWLSEQVGELNSTDAVFNESGVSYIDTAVSIERVYDLINQLDEPEEPETLARVLADYFIAFEKLKLALNMEVEELEE